MPRFSDGWVVDRTMYDYVSGGSCACCGMVHLFNPDGVKGLINSISDMETDAANKEIKATQKSPWPPILQEAIWADRVRLRHKMKREMKNYKLFCDKFPKEDVLAWLLDETCFGKKKLKKVFQMPRSQVTEILSQQYNIHNAFNTVLCAVLEQVANFKVTKYPIDARGEVEIAYEQIFTYNRRAGFTIPLVDKNDQLRKDILSIFVDMLYSLSGPKLLMRGPKTSKPTDNNNQQNTQQEGNEQGGADDPDNEDDTGATGPSFRSDRRILRLLIARYWSDLIIKAYSDAITRKAMEHDNDEFAFCVSIIE